MAIETADLMKIVAGSGVTSALFTWGLNHFLVYRPSLKRDGRYLAQRVAILLEEFAADCANIISDNQLHNSSSGHAGTQHLGLNPFPALPAEADWKAIAPDLTDRIMTMPGQLALCQRQIAFLWTVTDEDEMQIETNHQAGQYGLYAWNLAAEFRKKYGIPASKMHFRTWNFVAELQKQSEAAEKIWNKELKFDPTAEHDELE